MRRHLSLRKCTSAGAVDAALASARLPAWCDVPTEQCRCQERIWTAPEGTGATPGYHSRAVRIEQFSKP